MQLIKRVLIIALVVALIAIPINDVVRYLGAFYNLDNVTRQSAQAAAESAKSSGGDTRGPGMAAVEYAAARGVHVYGYEQVQGTVTVWTDMKVTGTLAWGPIAAAMAGVPFKDWLKTPPTIKSKAEAFAL